MASFIEYNEGLSQRQINQVRRLFESGCTINEICQIFKVSSWYIIRLLQGENSKKIYFLCPHCRRSFENSYYPMCSCHGLTMVIDAAAHATN
ncbi:MAG: hypothetical protein IKW80_10915 [Thermoguttaceae bacterium]|nr:hypothetical protein [Thermoguttaceae bacterium]